MGTVTGQFLQICCYLRDLEDMKRMQVHPTHQCTGNVPSTKISVGEQAGSADCEGQPPNDAARLPSPPFLSPHNLAAGVSPCTPRTSMDTIWALSSLLVVSSSSFRACSVWRRSFAS